MPPEYSTSPSDGLHAATEENNAKILYAPSVLFEEDDQTLSKMTTNDATYLTEPYAFAQALGTQSMGDQRSYYQFIAQARVLCSKVV